MKTARKYKKSDNPLDIFVDNVTLLLIFPDSTTLEY